MSKIIFSPWYIKVWEFPPKVSLFFSFLFSPSDAFCHISHNHITHKMPSTRTYHPILRSFNNASVAMPSLATASRIPIPQRAPVARLPIATARSIPRPVNSLSVARKYIPTVQRARPSTTIATMASSLAAMSISKPVNQAIASPSAPKPASPLPRVAVPCTKLASDRIQARRQKVIANLHAAKKRPTAPASIRQSSSMPSRAVPLAAVAPASIPQPPSMLSRAVPPASITPVSILKSPSKPSRVIPPPPPGFQARRSTLVALWVPPRGRKPRGGEPYCQRRPQGLVGDYQPTSGFGIECACHTTDEDRTGPRLWKTTPAEADVDPKRPRIVRFADNLVQSTKTFRPWYNDVWPAPENSEDYTTEAEDDAAIAAMDDPPPGSSHFQSTWQAMMDEGFSDDDDHYL